MTSACFDTGVLTLYATKDCPARINEVMNKVKKGELEAHVLSPVLSELFFHLCKLSGQEKATIFVNSLLESHQVNVILPDKVLSISAGKLRCQHRSTLSYIDCMSIAHALKVNIPFHTTEKKLKQIPGNVLQRLKVVKYELPSEK
ncbi:MAG: type II toxin-antitoxin system VapC family toxin [Candidatus Lokiarchaeota archaeon]|nr:type II toxin-antitoxin system VapC family toxin [Candidatus Lokiarchaeota archaeon]